MASVNVGEDDFTACALGANALWQDGQHEQAKVLDKLARKINALLSQSAVPFELRLLSGHAPRIKWQDVPSTLPEA